MLVRLVREECKRDAKDVDILRCKHITAFSQIIACPTKATANDLLTEQLAGECAKAQNVCHCFGIPAFGQHAEQSLEELLLHLLC